MSSIYERIDELCKNHNTNVTAMCRELKIQRSSLSELKAGRAKSISADKVAKIADYFGVTASYITEGITSPTKISDKDLDINNIRYAAYEALENESDDYMTNDINGVIERLKNCIEKSELSYVELEKRTGIAKSSIQRYATGTTKKIPVDSVQAIALALGVSPEYILGWSENKSIYNIENIEPLPKMKKVPLLGTIACGEPILADENVEDYINMPEATKGTFALRCKGDSMINARIFDGDIVYIREQPEVENGEIAAIIIDNEATLKRVQYFPKKNMIILKPENPKYEDFIYANEELENIKIIGKAVGFYSRVR